MTVLRGDCVEVMAGMEPDSVDAICTDPPYGLEFMGKEWDRLFDPRANGGFVNAGSKTSATGTSRPRMMGPSYQAGAAAQTFHAQWATAALRVARPGAYLLAFGGTRTVHRMTCALEDAGWVIRDMLVWAYAQGFPKSRASLKPAWEPIVMARKPGPLRDLNIDAARLPIGADDPQARHETPGNGMVGQGGVYAGGYSGDYDGAEQPHPGSLRHDARGRWPANVILTDPILDGGWDGVVGGGEQERWFSRPNNAAQDADPFSLGAKPAGYDPDTYKDTGTYSRFFLIPDTRSTVLSGTMDTCPTCSASTAESPSGTRADATNTAALTAPTTPGGRNVPGAPGVGSRSLWAETSTAPSPAQTPPDGTQASTVSEVSSGPISSDTTTTTPSSSPAPLPGTTSPSGQPASPAAALTTSTGTTTTTPSRWTCGHSAEPATTGSTPQQPKASSDALLPVERPDYGRFYLQPKAPTRERVLSDGRRSPHPTQKPEALIRHLVTLVTPPGGLVLDPFLGSGTLGVVCDGLGMRWAGIEREPEYADWAEARIADRSPEWAVA